MKIKSQYLALLVILFVGGVTGILFFTPDNMKALFSRSVDTDTGEITLAEGDEPKPAVESLDGQQPLEEMLIDFDALIAELEKELLETQNDPEKALEIRRRIQVLKTQKEASIPEEDNL